MPQPAGFWPLALLMFATGIGIPVLATLNAQLGQQVGSAIIASFIAFLVGAVLSGLLMVATVGAPDLSRLTFERPWTYFGVVFMIFYIVSITYAAPRIGIGNAVFFVLLGQLIAAALVDHFGLLGALRFGLTPRRVLGMGVMMVGVYLAKRDG